MQDKARPEWQPSYISTDANQSHLTSLIASLLCVREGIVPFKIKTRLSWCQWYPNLPSQVKWRAPVLPLRPLSIVPPYVHSIIVRQDTRPAVNQYWQPHGSDPITWCVHCSQRCPIGRPKRSGLCMILLKDLEWQRALLPMQLGRAGISTGAVLVICFWAWLKYQQETFSSCAAPRWSCSIDRISRIYGTDSG